MRIMMLGEGERDVGRMDPAVKRGRPCDFEGDLPRLVRRLSELEHGRSHFGYDAETHRGIAARFPISGRGMRKGRKSKELRNAVLAALQTHEVVIALIDARTEELSDLQRDVQDILTPVPRALRRGARGDRARRAGDRDLDHSPRSRGDARPRSALAVAEQPVPDDLERLRSIPESPLAGALRPRPAARQRTTARCNEDQQRLAAGRRCGLTSSPRVPEGGSRPSRATSWPPPVGACLGLRGRDGGVRRIPSSRRLTSPVRRPRARERAHARLRGNLAPCGAHAALD